MSLRRKRPSTIRTKYRSKSWLATAEPLEPRQLLSGNLFTVSPGFVTGPIVADTARDVFYLADQTGQKIIAVNTDLGATTAATAIAAPAGGLAVSYDDSMLLVSEPSLKQVQELSLPSLRVVATLSVGLPVYAIAASAHGEIYGASDTGLYEFTSAGVQVGRISAVEASYRNSRLQLVDNGNFLYAAAPDLTNDNYGIEEYRVATAMAYESRLLSTSIADGTDFAVSADDTSVYSIDPSNNLFTVSSTYSAKVTTEQNYGGGSFTALAPGLTGGVYASTSGSSAEIEDYTVNGSFDYDSSFVNAPNSSNSGVAPHGLAAGVNGAILIVSPDGTEVSLESFSATSFSLTTSPTSVSGTVFTDTSDTGSTAVSGSGVGGATVFADYFNSGSPIKGEPSTTTAADGTYTLTGLGLTSRDIRVLPPAGYVSTGNGAGLVTVTAPATGVNFPVFQGMTVNGLAFVDSNGNGRRDTNEAVAVQAQVFEDLNHNGVYDSGEPEAISNASGQYTLTGVVPSVQYPGADLILDFVPISGTVSEQQNVAIAPQSGGVIVLNNGESPTSVVSGTVVLNPTNASPVGIGGQTVFADLNNNGQFDAGEPSATTDGNGQWSIGGLASGNVTFDLVPAAGYAVQGTATAVVTLGSRDHETAPNFIVTANAATQTGSISGTTFVDANANGVDDPGELPVAGRTVYLDTNHNGVFDAGEPSAVSDASGAYLFTGLNAGTYLVRQSVPANTPDTTGVQTVNLTNVNGTTLGYSGLNLGSQPATTASISGTVFNDINGDGVQETGEGGVANVMLYLDLNGDGSLDSGDQAVTSTAAGFSFSGIAPGTYKLYEFVPNSYESTYPTFAIGQVGQSVTVTAGATTYIQLGINQTTPVANSGGPYTVVSGAAVTLNASASTVSGNGRIVKYEWELNYDGTPSSFTPNLTSTTPTLSTTYFRTVTFAGEPETLALRVTDLTGNTSIAITTIAVTAAANSIFCDVTNGTTGETIYLDANNNGHLDPGELSQSLDVYSNESQSGVIFTNIPAGSYNVRQSGYAYTQTYPVYNASVPIVVDGVHTPDEAFFINTGVGEFNTISGQITGGPANETIFLDANNDGIVDDGELTTTTNSSGAFSFNTSDSASVEGINGESYIVRQILPSGYAQVTPAFDSGIPVTASNSQTISNVNFVDVSSLAVGKLSGVVNGSSAGETVYLDANNNGVRDSGELSTTTATGGAFSFTNVPVGSYVVRQVLPTGYTQTSPAGNAGIAINVTTGASLTGENFTDAAPPAGGSVSGVVTNGQTGETIYLDANNNSALDSTELSTTLLADGTYGFTGVAAGAYVVRQVLPNGFTQTSPAGGYGIHVTVTNGGSLTGENFADTAPVVVTTGSVAGTVTGGVAGEVVYLDANNNGTLDSGDLSTTTSSAGAFSFASIPAGSYVLRQVLPTGYTQTTPAGNAGIAITVAAGSALTGENFVDAAPVAAGGSISGTVFDDANGNAAFDSTEAGIAGITVYNDANNNSILDPGEASTVTSSGGAYTFANLVAGNYKIRAILPGGYKQTTPANNYGFTIALKANQVVAGDNFGQEAVVTAGSVAGTVTGGVAGETVYLDANSNGTLDSGELSTTTSSTGAFSFAGVPVGSYVLRQVLPTGYTQTTPSGNAGIALTVAAGSALANENFVDAAPAAAGGSVSGTVANGLTGETIYLDANNNSVLDPTELSTTTSATGFYSFSNVPVGAYVVRQVLPSGYTQTSPASNYGIHVSVTNGGSLSGNNFTDKAPVVATTGSVSGTVTGGPAGEVIYLDANGNGVLDSNELSTTTASTGAFSFAGVPAGSYVLRQVLAGGYTQASPASNAGIAVAVTAGGSLTNENFIDTAPASTGGSVSGTVTGGAVGETVYLDANNNSVLDGTELSTTTSATGTFSFTNVPAGAYIVRQVLPSGYTQTSPSGGLGIHLTVTAASSFTGENFTDKAPAAVHTKLTGTTIGTAGSYNNSGNTIAKATDGSLSTYFDAQASNGNWVGYDLGTATSISQIAYAPRSGYGSRMVGGQIQISTSADFSTGVTTIYTIGSAPPNALTTITLSSPVTAQYIRYLSPDSSHGDISEFEAFS